MARQPKPSAENEDTNTPTPASVGDLTFDPQNARKHGKANLELLRKSLQEVGAARSIVIDENNVILAGEGVIQSAREEGMEKLLVVEGDGETIVAVRRRGLTADQKRRLALLDNRVAELAEWDKDVLQALLDENAALLDDLWSKGGLAELLEALEPPVMQIMPLLFLPKDAERLEGLVRELRRVVKGKVFEQQELWSARFKDYEPILAKCDKIMQERSLLFVGDALLYALEFWEEHRECQRLPDT